MSGLIGLRVIMLVLIIYSMETINLKLNAKVGENINPEIKQISFTINRPWYLSNFMFINYLYL